MSLKPYITFFRNCLISVFTGKAAPKSNFWAAVLTLFFIVSVTHLLPTGMGLSFWPLPYGPYTDSGPMGSLMMPANITAVDNFSFPHVDWPWRKVSRHFIELGEFPLWNPYSSLGLPFVPQYENQLFFPLEWIEIFGNPYLWNLLLIVKILLAGIGAMLLVRHFCSTAPSIFAAGLIYAFSGYFLWLNTIPGFINGATIVPWLFLSIIHIFDEHIHILRRIGQLALALGFLWLSGQPQIAALSSLSAGLLFAWYWFRARAQNPVKPLLIGIIGVGLGLLIAAPQLWLFAEALGQSYSLHSPGSYKAASTKLLNFTLLIWPFLFGQLMSPWDRQLFPTKINWEAFPLVVGTSGLLLFVYGVGAFVLPSRESKRPYILFPMVSILMLSFLIIISGSLGYPLWKMQGLNRINFPRYIVPVLSVCVACFCAWGVENLRWSSLRRFLFPLIFFLIFAGKTATMVWPILRSALSSATIDSAYLHSSLVLGIVPSIIVLITWVAIAFISNHRKADQETMAWAVVAVSAGELIFFVRLGFSVTNELLRLTTLGIICSAAVTILWRRKYVTNILVAAAVLSFVAILAFADHRLAAVRDPYITPPNHIAFLQSVSGLEEGNPRILSSQGLMTPDVGNAFGLSELASLNPLQIDRTARIILDLLSTKKLDYTAPTSWPGVSSNIYYPSWEDYFARRSNYNAFAVEYLVDSPNGPLSRINDASIKPVYRDSNVTIYRDLLAMPRAYVINAARPIKDFDKVLLLMKDSKIDPRTQAVVEAFPYELPTEITQRSVGQVNRLAINYFGSTRVEIALNSDAEGLAVLADAYYPGWKAEIDGKPQRIFIVNGVLRGVVVEPGDKVLTFSYMPRRFPLILIVAVLSLLFSLYSVLVLKTTDNVKNMQNSEGI